MSRLARHGFTRLELLALLVAIFLLMGLLLPGFWRPHEGVRRTYCMNNQMQIAEAMTIFATTHGMMPAAMSVPIDPATGKPVATPFGWAQGLFAELGRRDLVPATYTMTAANAPNVELFICPDDGNKHVSSGGPLSYCVNGGGFKHWHSDGSFDCLDNGVWNNRANAMNQPTPKLNLDYIEKHKGLSLTISHSENIDARSYILSSPRAGYEDEILWDQSAPLGFNQDVGNGKLDNAHARPSSNHGGGAVVAFCDGHVAFISDSIAYNVYATLMVSNPAAGPAGFLVWPLNPSQIPVK